MAIDKKLIHFKTKENFNSANGVNGSVDAPTAGSEANGNAEYGQIKGTSIVFIKDSGEIWTHGNLYRSVNWSKIKEIDGIDEGWYSDDYAFDDDNKMLRSSVVFDDSAVPVDTSSFVIDDCYLYSAYTSSGYISHKYVDLEIVDRNVDWIEFQASFDTDSTIDFNGFKLLGHYQYENEIVYFVYIMDM